MKHIALFTHLLVPALLTSCGKKDKAAGGPPPGAWPANCVVAPATTQEIDDEVLLVATLAAKESVKLVSELDAAITDIKVREGQAVKKDAVLFQLDDVQTKAHLEEAKASFTLATSLLLAPCKSVAD
jgi:multidrug efflux pump subunit AcrA (membrane-fusion protein)